MSLMSGKSRTVCNGAAERCDGDNFTNKQAYLSGQLYKGSICDSFTRQPASENYQSSVASSLSNVRPNPKMIRAGCGGLCVGCIKGCLHLTVPCAVAMRNLG